MRPLAVAAALFGACFMLTAPQVYAKDLSETAILIVEQDSDPVVCSVLEKRKNWHYALALTEARWGIDSAIIYALIDQTWQFDNQNDVPRWRKLVTRAKTPKSPFAGGMFEPTWARYTFETGQSGAKPNRFSDYADFTAWYLDASLTPAYLDPNDPVMAWMAWHLGGKAVRYGAPDLAPAHARRAAEFANSVFMLREDMPTCFEEEADTPGFFSRTFTGTVDTIKRPFSWRQRRGSGQ